MADKTITLTLQGVDNASTPIRDVQTNYDNLVRSLDANTSAVQGMSDAYKNAGDNTKSASDEAKKADTVFSRAAGNIVSRLTEFGVQGVIDVGRELYEAGRAANVAEEAFTNLGLEETDLAGMRSATRNAVSDTSLMQTASQMLAMNLASTGEQAAELMEIGTGLGQIMGEDATSAMQNFNAALANQSYERLDALGISAGAVRVRVAELKDEGLSMEEAFSQAVLEQGRLAMERFGSAVDMAVGPMDRLQARVENFAATAGQNIAAAVDPALAAIENADLLWIQQTQGDLAAWTESFRRTNQVLIEERAAAFAALESGTDFNLDDTVDSAAEVNEVFLDLMYGMHRFMEANGRMPQTVGEVEAAYRDLTGYTGAWTEELAAAANYILGANYAAEELAEEQIRAALASERQATAAAESARMAERQAAHAATVREEFGERWATDNIDAASATIAEMSAVIDSTRGVTGDTFLFSQEEADRLDAAAEDVEAQLAAAHQMHDQGLISEDQLANLESSAEHARGLADAAADGAKAFADMSLSELFQQGGGGAMADATQIVMDELAAMGIEGTQADSIEQSFDLASGVQTQTSVAFDEEVAPMIAALANEQGGAVAAALLNEFLLQMEALRLAGATDEEMAAATSAFANSGGAVLPAESEAATDAAALPIAPDAAVAGTGAEGTVDGETTVAGQALPDALVSADELAIKMTSIEDQIARMTENVHRIQFELVITGSPTQMGFDWLAQTLRAVVEGNGGVVPGTVGS